MKGAFELLANDWRWAAGVAVTAVALAALATLVAARLRLWSRAEVRAERHMPFEWFVAWRYVRRGEQARFGLLALGLVLLGAGSAAAFAGHYFVPPPDETAFASDLLPLLQRGGETCLAAACGLSAIGLAWRALHRAGVRRAGWAAVLLACLVLALGGLLAAGFRLPDLPPLRATRTALLASGAVAAVLGSWLVYLVARRGAGAAALPLALAAMAGPLAALFGAAAAAALVGSPLLNVQRIFLLAGAGEIIAGTLIAYFGLLFVLFSLFTAISTFGVSLGTLALVVVLSVMNGFATDLRVKILGSNAHILVTKVDGLFTDYQEVERKVAAAPGVLGDTPFVSGEVMLTSPANYQGIVLKGIDPATVWRVTDLRRDLRDGSLDLLVHPEKLRDEAVLPLPAFEPSAPPTSQRAAVAPGAGVAPPTSPAAPTQGRERAAKRPDGWPGGGLLGLGDDLGPGDIPPPPPPIPERPVLPGILLGQEAAKNLRVFLGDDVELVSPLGGIGPTGMTAKTKSFRVAGRFYTGMYEYDTKFAYVTIPEAQRFLDLPGAVSGIEIRTRDPDHVERVDAALASALGPAYRVQDWKELNRNLFSALNLEKVAMFILLAIIILVASFSILSNLIMVVVEKGREIAILKAMGAADRGILRVFLIEGIYIGGIGALVGIGLGIVGCLALRYIGLGLPEETYYISQLPVQMSAGEIVASGAAALGITLLATTGPSWIAARMRPVDGLRYE